MSMNTEQCKDLIGQMMNNLLAGVTGEDLYNYEMETGGGDLGDVVDQKLWKRVSKTGSTYVTRVFKHKTVEATITLTEVPNADGTVNLEVDMTELPRALQKATTVVAEMNLPGNDGIAASLARRTESRPSMTEGPKPDGFGAFA